MIGDSVRHKVFCHIMRALYHFGDSLSVLKIVRII